MRITTLRARVAAYPKASASWTALEGTQDGASVSQIRLRAAYGQSGQQPGDLAALTYFSPIVVTGRDGSPRTGASLGGSGDPTLKPERSGEIEVGVDFAGWHNRLTAKITAYRKRTRDAIVLRPLPPSAGTTEVRAENIGQVLNEGLEVSLLSRPIESPGFSRDLGVEAAFNRNRLEDLGGTPPLVTFQTMSVVGRPLFPAYDYKLLSYHDANGDGVIGPEEIVMSDSTEILGSSIPTTIRRAGGLSLFADRPSGEGVLQGAIGRDVSLAI